MKKFLTIALLFALGAGSLKAQQAIQYRDYTIKQEGANWNVYEDDWRVPARELHSLPEALEFINWLEHGNC